MKTELKVLVASLICLAACLPFAYAQRVAVPEMAAPVSLTAPNTPAAFVGVDCWTAVNRVVNGVNVTITTVSGGQFCFADAGVPDWKSPSIQIPDGDALRVTFDGPINSFGTSGTGSPAWYCETPDGNFTGSSPVSVFPPGFNTSSVRDYFADLGPCIVTGEYIHDFLVN